MKVWIVGTSDCESYRIDCVYSNRESAIKRMFQIRDELIKDWTKQNAWASSSGYFDDMYQGMIKSLQDNDYTKWDNYPHEQPFIDERDVME